MNKLRLAASALMAVAIFCVTFLPTVGWTVEAQSSGSFSVTSVSRSCDANELIVNVENTTGQSWSLEVLFANSSSSSSSTVDDGDQGLSSSAVVPYNGDPFDEVMLTIWLNDGWRFSYGAFVGLCGESFEAYFNNSWAPVPQVDIAITNASCTSFDWLVNSTQPLRLEIGVIKPAAAGDFPVEIIDMDAGERTGTFVPGLDWPSMFLYVRAYSEVTEGVFEFQADQQLLIEDCAAVLPTVPPVVPTPTESPIGSTVTIVVTMPDGSSIEGAPWALYAPMAAMQAVGAFASGVVGPNNTIVIVNVPDGEYTLVISPDGYDPVTLAIAVSGGPDGAQIIPVNLAAPTITPAVTPPTDTETPTATGEPGIKIPTTVAPTSTVSTAADESSATDPVSGLPNTGSGSSSTSAWMVWVASIATLLGSLGIAASRGVRRR